MSQIENTVVDASVEEKNPNEVIHAQFMEIVQTLSTFKSTISMLASQLKILDKSVKKNIKRLEKESKKNKNKGNRKASGFAVPTKISNDLCKFIKVS